MNAARSKTAWMPKVRSKLLARLNSRSRSLCRLVDGGEDDCSLFLFVNKVDDGDAPVNFRIGCGGEELLLLLLLLLISYISNDSFLMSSEEFSSLLEEAALVKDLKRLVGCLI